MGNVYRSGGNKCPICGEQDIQILSIRGVFSDYYCYICSHCGEYFASDRWNFHGYSRLEADSEYSYDEEKLKSYLFYHKGKLRPFLVSENTYAQFDKEDFSHIYNLSPAMVEAWYPKTFAEKVDKILLYLAQKTKYMGEELDIYYQDLAKIYFITHKPIEDIQHTVPESVLKQIDYLNNYFENTDLLSFGNHGFTYPLKWNQRAYPTITPKGWERIDALQKNQVSSKNVFIAMSFAEEAITLRETLKQAISEAGYVPVLIDEVQYNGQIIPEMLYQIRESRFVIAELSHHNNGAYYEAGYALGLGKEVIHICEKEALGSKLHFDVKQVNTITYKADDLEELKERLIKRIQATIK